jgi:hypothetical protein
MAVVQARSSGPPCAADRVLWAMAIRPVRISKFCTSLAALVPGLPANRWTRARGRPWTRTGPEATRFAAARPGAEGLIAAR